MSIGDALMLAGCVGLVVTVVALAGPWWALGLASAMLLWTGYVSTTNARADDEQG